ncbi:DNA glycosylase [Bisporella sp. PMI_857]|nr:DNA glycosylase [Bisporella sp. PMI_857]
MSLRRSARLNTSSDPKDEISVKVANTGKKRKSIPTAVEPSKKDEGPSTPKRKRTLKQASPLATPIPAVAKLMSTTHAPNETGIFGAPPVRLAAPDISNATLISPETHRVVAQKPLDELSPSKVSKINVTTKNALDEALAHLIKVEPKLKPIIENHPCTVFSPEGLAEEIDPFNSLVSGIISQQVSGAAAKSIKTKFVAMFNPGIEEIDQHTFPTPSQVCNKSLETLRTAGLSQRKAEYIHGLAEKFKSGELTTSMLLSAPYEEVFEELIKVRGLGKWSVEMFACFSLKRMDVFSTGDLGIQRGMAALLGRDVDKLKAGKGGKWKYMKEQEMEEVSDKFKPYRSVYMWYLWRCADVNISTFDEP